MRLTAEPLRSEGFRRHGQRFVLDRGNWAIVAFQKARGHDRDDVVFTVNLAIASRVLRTIEGHDPNQAPTEPESHLRLRLGMLLPPHREYWWRVGSTGDIENVAGLVRRELTQSGLPFLLTHLSDAELARLWRTGRSPGITELQRLRYLALLTAAHGPRDSLPSLMRQLETLSHGHAEAVRTLIAERVDAKHVASGPTG